MSDNTVRVTLWEGENEEIYITDADYNDGQHLKDYGIDIPVELLDENRIVHARWKEFQAKLVKFVESLEPAGREDAFREVVFCNSYTWDKFDRQPDCEHTKTIAVMRKNQSGLAEIVDRTPARGGRTCVCCGSYLYWVMDTTTVEQRFFTEEIRSSA